MTKIQTERLLMRQWRDADRAAFASLNADPEVMEYFPKRLSRGDSDAMIDRLRAHIDDKAWGLWALERRDNGEFIGFTGLSVPAVSLPFTPCVEVGWRLARTAWHQGFASEAARAAIDYGFTQLHLTEILSFTAIGNLRSRAVMERIGMQNRDENFFHPAVDPDSPLCEHVLYGIEQKTWVDQAQSTS